MQSFATFLLHEAHTPVPWRWTPDSNIWDRYAEFVVGEYPYQVTFYSENLENADDRPIPARPEPLGEKWVLTFGQGGKLGSVGSMKRSYPYISIRHTGNAHAVFATVVEIVKDFITNASPNAIYFDAREASRIKLYQRLSHMAPQFNPAYHYDPTDENEGDFLIYRDPPIEPEEHASDD